MKNTIKTYLSAGLIFSLLIVLTGCSTQKEVQIKTPVTKTTTEAKNSEAVVDVTTEGVVEAELEISELETESEDLLQEDADLEAELNALEELDF